MNKASINVGIVGATGVVGQELLRLLRQRKFPLSALRLFASGRSAGKVVEFDGKGITVDGFPVTIAGVAARDDRPRGRQYHPAAGLRPR